MATTWKDVAKKLGTVSRLETEVGLGRRPVVSLFFSFKIRRSH